jgi:hypothetical protein
VSWYIVPLLPSLWYSALTPFHHSSGAPNHFLILSHWDLCHSYSYLMFAVPSLRRPALYVVRPAIAVKTWLSSLMPCWWVFGHTTCNARRIASSALAFFVNCAGSPFQWRCSLPSNCSCGTWSHHAILEGTWNVVRSCVVWSSRNVA